MGTLPGIPADEELGQRKEEVSEQPVTGLV